MNRHKERIIEQYPKKQSLLERLLEGGGDAKTEPADKIFSEIAELLVAGNLEAKIVPLDKFLALSGGENVQADYSSKELPDPCAIVELSEEGDEDKYTAYIPKEYPPEQRAKALLHEALHVLFDKEGGDVRETVELSAYHKKIYAAEDMIWSILTDESKEWLRQFVGVKPKYGKRKRLPTRE